MKIKLLFIAILIPLLFAGCDGLFDEGDVEKTFEGPPQVALFPLEQEVSEIDGSTSVEIQLIGEPQNSDITVTVTADGASTAQAGVHYNIASNDVTIAGGTSTVDLPIEILDSGAFTSGEVQLILNIDAASGGLEIAPNLDQASVFISEFERDVALQTQALDGRSGDSELLVTGIIGQPTDVVLITTNPAGDDFTGETIVGEATLGAAMDGGSLLVDIGGAAPVDYAAHVIRGHQYSTEATVSASTASNIDASSSAAAVYSVVQFNWDDETAIDSTNTVTVDVIEIEYNGTIGEDSVSIDLHAVGDESSIGAFVGISANDLEVNMVHLLVAVEIVEPVSPGDDEAERVDDYIRGTGTYFAMTHLGGAGLDADGNRIPAQRPALITGLENADEELTFFPIGDFAEVAVDTTAVP